MDTRSIILDAALCLFNQEGFEATSARQIARVVRISQGNLRYHYATKEAIAKQLFTQFYERYQKVLQPLSQGGAPITMAHLLDTYRQLFELYSEYRFIILDLWNLTRRLTGVQDLLRKDYRDRQTTFVQIMEGLTANGQMEDLGNPVLLKRIIDLQLFIGDYWIAHGDIYLAEELSGMSGYYPESWLTPLLPYLTAAGLEALMEYSRKHRECFCNDFNQIIQFHYDRRLDLDVFSDS